MRERMASLRNSHLHLRKMLNWLWKQFLLFLEVIGLREERAEEREVQLARFKQYHTEFRKLLSTNNSFLECVADLEVKLLGQEHFDSFYVTNQVIRAVRDIHHMVDSLNVISTNRYGSLVAALQRITVELTPIIEVKPAQAPKDLVLDLAAITHEVAEHVGGKMGNLAEIHNVARLPTPDGFAVTTEGCRLLIESAGLRSLLQLEDMNLAPEERGADPSRDPRERIRQAALPAPLRDAIESAYDRLATRAGARPRPPLVAVRSSAVGEDGHLSFAGQFTTVLNVARQGLGDAYVEVVSSLYSPEAVHYRMFHKIPGESAQMAAGFVTMVDAVASGVVFTRDPGHPDSGRLLIQAVHGLGVTLVDGRAVAEHILLTRDREPTLVSHSIAHQESQVVMSPDAGLREEALPAPADLPVCLRVEEAIQLARCALALEDHFGGPQDIEWAIDASRNLVLLQARPLRIPTSPPRREEPRPGAPVLLAGGEMACPGVGTGPAVHLDEGGDLDAFPDGGVLVARRSSPRFVRLMKKARAIVTDFGGATGHMASLAREFRLPTLLNTKKATQTIPPGALVTVDATAGYVYGGNVPGLAEERASEAVGSAGAAGVANPRRTAALQLLERASRLIAPLNLTDPRSPEFRPDSCRTLHDLARFAHEKSYEEMFGIGESLGDFRASSYHLDVFLPMDLYIIDLDGGIEAPPRGRKVKRAQVRSVPLAALLDGMLDKGIPRFGPRPMDVRGLASIMMRHALTSPENERTFRDPCYAMVSDRYLNYTARVGYHFGIVDSYCGQTANKNYISILFRGGAADIIRRQRRTRAIAGILRSHGFSVEVNKDVVTARLSKQSQEEIVRHLEMVGRLLQFMRQMDLAMSSESAVQWVQDAFLSGDYRLERTNRSSQPSPGQ
jgi:pyruvate, water dikinase